MSIAYLSRDLVFISSGVSNTFQFIFDLCESCCVLYVSAVNRVFNYSILLCYEPIISATSVHDHFKSVR